MPPEDIHKEQWIDSTPNSVWERNSDTRSFSLLQFRGKHIDNRWSVADYSRALNCSIDKSSEGATAEAVFPPDFMYSPDTGKPLDKLKSKISTWLPNSGSENLKSGLLRAGRLTDHPIKIDGDADDHLINGPVFNLPLPGPGTYRFCVGSFGLSSSFLMAFNSAQGVIYCWIPSRHEWAELTSASESSYLVSDAISPDMWNVEVQDLDGDSIIHWPSDRGLIALKIDVLSLSYSATSLAEGRCVSVPRIIKENIYVLIEKPEGAVSVIAVNSNNKPNETEISNIPPEHPWVVAASTPYEIIWLSSDGQIVIRPNARQYIYIPWEKGVEVLFQLGGPHCSLDGSLWMQVLHPTINDGEKGLCFIKLGCNNPEIKPSWSARMLTGNTSLKVEKWLKDDPWIEETVVTTNESETDEAVIPVLESISEHSLLVVRLDHKMGIAQLFERTDESLPARFQVMGQHKDTGFWVKQLQRPWMTSAFIFDEVLYIYHPGIKSLPGWKTISSR